MYKFHNALAGCSVGNIYYPNCPYSMHMTIFHLFYNVYVVGHIVLRPRESA